MVPVCLAHQIYTLPSRCLRAPSVSLISCLCALGWALALPQPSHWGELLQMCFLQLSLTLQREEVLGCFLTASHPSGSGGNFTSRVDWQSDDKNMNPLFLNWKGTKQNYTGKKKIRISK